MLSFNSIRATQLETCQPSHMSIKTQYSYILIDNIFDDNQNAKSETKVQILDQNSTNLVQYGQYYILKRGVRYAIPRRKSGETEQIQLVFEHIASGSWTPDFDLERFQNNIASQFNQERNKEDTIEVLKIGESRMTSQNKYQILDTLGKLKEENIKFTEQRTKKALAKIYIKVISCESNSNQVRVKIQNTSGRNRLSYGDYYVIQLNTEYCMFSQLELDEEYVLIFNEKVSFEWIPDFPVDLDPSAGIQAMRRGEYFTQNQYFYDNVPVCVKVEVTGRLTTRMLAAPLSNADYNKPDFKPLTYVKRHEPLLITLLYGDFGKTTYNGMEGWVCIRYVTKLGKEGACACGYCSPFYLQKQPLELYKPKQPLKRSQVINEQIQRQIYRQYANCQCQHCYEVKQSAELFYIDQQIEMVKLFYQKSGRCIDYGQIARYLNALFSENYEPKQIQKLFLERILPKMKKQIPDNMMEELHKFSTCIYKDQLPVIRDAVVKNMNVLMKDYDNAKVKEGLKNWITYKTPDSQKLTEMEIQNTVRIIVNKYYAVHNENIQSNTQNEEACIQILAKFSESLVNNEYVTAQEEIYSPPLNVEPQNQVNSNQQVNEFCNALTINNSDNNSQDIEIKDDQQNDQYAVQCLMEKVNEFEINQDENLNQQYNEEISAVQNSQSSNKVYNILENGLEENQDNEITLKCLNKQIFKPE
ncbi:Hypothetical_protein [Hexamita inflata]|uniref:Hypothetical_protein n=1 Tax=Hexamita inflata TaxID=28002 RepID=A0AA86R189_9EUKA|nr:Hypothetical protein HINF_LOCUS57484 [Hexamita inflata]